MMESIHVFLRYLRRLFFFMKEEENTVTYEEIKEGVYFRGYNLWILSFAMIIACIGLNTNSISAIIGAMLISPLMGPIIGMAFGMAIDDGGLRRSGFQNWLLMTVVSLLSATVYFLLSPFDNNTELISSFQKATIFDISLAFFGGMAGFIGIIKKEGTKILAGVAIATACMPPLCTASYGIAHLDVGYFLGGLYFYLINCMFIGLATFLLARYFGYRHSHTKIGTMTKAMWYVLIVLMLLPGSYIAYQKWHEQKGQIQMISDKTRIEILEKKVAEMDSLLRLK